MTLSVKADAVTTLEWALDQFTAVERSVPTHPPFSVLPAVLTHAKAPAMAAPPSLAGRNQYLCTVCGRSVDAERSIQLAQLPRIFCFHVHRFTDQGTVRGRGQRRCACRLG